MVPDPKDEQIKNLEMVNRELYDHEQMLYEELVKRGWVGWCDHHKDYCSATFGSHVIRGFEFMEARIKQCRWRMLWAGLVGIYFGILIGAWAGN